MIQLRGRRHDDPGLRIVSRPGTFARVWASATVYADRYGSVLLLTLGKHEMVVRLTDARVESHLGPGRASW